MDKVSHWTKQIERMLDDGNRYQLFWGYLKSVKNEINEKNRITDNQITAIKNIRYGKQRIEE